VQFLGGKTVSVQSADYNLNSLEITKCFKQQSVEICTIRKTKPALLQRRGRVANAYAF